MNINEIRAKSILSVSKVYDYVINPYVGCQHGCSYCYARYMKRFTGHKEAWGEFVDVKVNAAELLQQEIGRKKKGSIWISGVCDPYQPLEARYQLTRRCLQILAQHDWPVTVQTRSSLVLRDIDVLKTISQVEVGLSVTTADDAIRKLFEPHAPSVTARLDTLAQLHRAGIRTFAMIAPILPGVENLVRMLAGTVDYILVDRMNYHYADHVYKQHGLEQYLAEDYFDRAGQLIKSDCQRLGIDCSILF